MAARHREIADLISQEILSGRLTRGERLPGENVLAERFSASRGTVRAALARLKDEGLIETWTGSGSYITYHGETLDDRLGWSRALAQHGIRTSTRLLRLERASLVDLADTLDLPDPHFLAVDRVRLVESGSTGSPQAISYERSRVPWREEFQPLLRTGLVGDSLSRTLAAHGIFPAGGQETVSLLRLDEAESRLLGASPGAPYLRLVRIVRDHAGVFVEHVTNVLDPDHFQLRTNFGQVSARGASSRG